MPRFLSFLGDSPTNFTHGVLVGGCPMIFQGSAKEVSIRLSNADGSLSGQICTALLTFLSPKDVCCLQVFEFAQGVEIRFLARPAKTEALIHTAALIAPSALIHVDDTTIVHAQSSPKFQDSPARHGDWRNVGYEEREAGKWSAR
jgi:hypothetical protein